jgi:DNA-directed RNA polymerase subunit RPC12/RpoP
MPYRWKGRARIDPENPRAVSICMRCGNMWNRDELAWQYDWIGQKLQNKQILVCPECMDAYATFRKTLILPVDPPAIFNPVIEPYAIDDKSNWTIQAPVGATSLFGISATLRAQLTKNGVT